MPLINGIRAWFGRRMSDASSYGMAASDGGSSMGSASWLWLIVFIVALPVVAVLVVVGLIYEIVIRIDGRRVGNQVEWAISAAVAAALLAGAYWVFFR
ncbi:MAG: hypothetical protein ABI725_04900 [Chloroflexota bacterium]